MSSSTKAWCVLLLFGLVILLGGHALAGREGLLWGLAISLSINGFVYFLTDHRWAKAFSLRELEGLDPWGLVRSVEKSSQIVRLPRPKIYVSESLSPQAAAWGRSWKKGSLLVSEGLLEKLTSEELDAVVAWLVAALRQQDTLSFNVATAFLSAAVSILNLLDTTIRAITASKNVGRQAHLATLLCGPLIQLWLRLAVGASTYRAIDARAAEITGDPEALARALWKLESFRETKPFSSPRSMAHHFVVNPLTGTSWSRYFQIQPSVEKRIKGLVGYYPI